MPYASCVLCLARSLHNWWVHAASNWGQEDEETVHPRVVDILASAETPAASIRPTELYNEGWMLRLVLDWAQQHASGSHPLVFLRDARWYSEALLGPPFLARWPGDKLAETWTNADGVVGQFDIGAPSKGGPDTARWCDATRRRGSEDVFQALGGYKECARLRPSGPAP